MAGYALAIGMAALALFAAACGGEPSPTATSQPQRAITTEDPLLGNVVGPADAMQQLLSLPDVGDVLRAVQDQDVDKLLALIDWRPHGCGYRDAVLCPGGVATGTELPMVDVGWPVQFWVTAETLRPALTELLAGAPLTLTFASKTTQPSSERGLQIILPTYYLGLEGPPRPVSPSALWGDISAMAGIFLRVDTGSERPIVELTPLTEQGAATERALSRGLVDHEVITFEAAAPVAIVLCERPVTIEASADIIVNDKPEAVGLFCGGQRWMEGTVIDESIYGPIATWRLLLTITSRDGSVTCQDEGSSLPVFRRCELGNHAITLIMRGPS